MKLSVAKYWFSLGYLDGYDGKPVAPPITIPANCWEFYERGHDRGESWNRIHNYTEAAKRVLCS
jgi:hypothetical protein